MLLVQVFLKTNSVDGLKQIHGVDVSYSKCRTKMSLNYNMIDADEHDKLASQCRGLILSKIDGSEFLVQKDVAIGDTIVQCYGFDRFFNFGQGCAEEIIWSDPGLKVLSKLDGTLCQVYFDRFKKEWMVSTRSCPEADIPLNGYTYTFTTLFYEGCRNATGLEFSEFSLSLDEDIAYLFELTSYYNRVVCEYPETSITLLGARSMKTFQELHLEEISVDVPKVAQFNLKSIEDVLKWVNEQKATEHEGVVISTSGFKRIKVKSVNYVLAHRFRDSVVSSDRNCLNAVLIGNYDDMIPLVPKEIVDKLQHYKDQVSKFIKNTDKQYDSLIASLPENYSKKDFALALKQLNVWETPFFMRSNGKVKDAADFINSSKKDGEWHAPFLDKMLDYV